MISQDTNLPELWSLIGTATWETVYMVAITVAIGGFLGLCVGLALYATRSGGLFANRVAFTLLNLVVNFFRPIPFVIFIATVQPLARLVVGIGIGNKAIIFAMTLAAMFGIARIVEQNLVTVDAGVIEAARSMGASRLRILTTVVVPEALGPLILGYTFAFVAIVDMSAIAGAIGAGGLGNFALQYGYRQFDTVVTWTVVLIIVVFVQLGQFLGNTAARRVLRY
ncbi:methionine ABC transporter permease [Aeromicrobium duanguangcaii]|uniref:ABC transporter permease n=1 Tax=Aeromicrobium duanguangcaii TaxID=2968086 RepID=A0ABY5KFN9_9ACTN|nr:methionine ABC transporter permease [Aeromicrobium duanguangcaii]MCD9153631.1 ABC transporter permease [Aeromicrobium duanguangcaii]MCL3836384.1 ABC transporter permease [Aeromicrobium duanguangcaii]UUI69286.1 ABC transporter permease [Aeromicrobium duanguangcaii]